MKQFRTRLAQAKAAKSLEEAALIGVIAERERILKILKGYSGTAEINDEITATSAKDVLKIPINET